MKKIEILHPIVHNSNLYSRGVGDFPDDLAETFLKMKDGTTGQPIARVPLDEPHPVKVKVTDVGGGKMATIALRDRL